MVLKHIYQSGMAKCYRYSQAEAPSVSQSHSHPVIRVPATAIFMPTIHNQLKCQIEEGW